MARKCICEICTCGRHRCPHRPRPTKIKGPCGISEYTHKYPAHVVDARRENFKPQQEFTGGDGQLSDQTTSRVDYIPHRVAPPKVRAPEQYQKMPGDMDLLTSYIRDYPQKKGEQVKAVKNFKSHIPGGEFKGTPTYQADYIKWSLPPREKLEPQAQYVPPNAAFDGLSTHTRDFQPKTVELRKSMKPSQHANLSTAPLDDKTSYRTAYLPHASQARYVRPKGEYIQNPHPFDGLTSFKRDYTNKRASIPQSFKPDNTPLMSDQPFSDDTTFRRDYLRWESQPPKPKVAEAWVQPAGQMDLNTTSRIAYPGYKVEPPAMAKPIHTSRSAEAPFDDRTNYNNDYQRWNTKPERRGNPTQKPYERSNIPFEGNSHYRTHFIPKHAQIPKSCGPHKVANMSSDPFDDRTMYKVEYTPKESSPCPAIDLNKSGYRFGEVDNRGHEVWLRKYSNGSFEQRLLSPPQQIDLQYASLA